MAGETPITVIGNLTGDPELRFTPSGHAVANFTVASTPRVFDRQANEWKDGDTLFMRCSIWREAAENVTESLVRGARVVATGRLVQRSWEDKETGQKRSAMEVQVDEVGPSLKYATAKVAKVDRRQGQGGRGGAADEFQGQADAWGAGGSQNASQGSSWGGQGGGPSWGGGPASYDEPPF